MSDTRIARAFLDDLFAKLAAGDLDPAHVDWPFAAEAWRAVRGEVERLRTEVKHHRQDKDLLAEELSEASICIERMSTPQRALIEKWRHEADRLDNDAAELSISCRDADAARRQAEAKLKRGMAAEIERVLEVEK